MLAIVFLPELFKPVLANIEVSFVKLFKSDNCKEKLGFKHQIKEHIKFALDFLCNNGQRIVLFVDNLDRCSSSNIKQILDTIGQFLEIIKENINSKIEYQEIYDPDPDEIQPENNKTQLFTVFAIDKEIILRALKNELGEEAKAENYLEKIINLAVDVEFADEGDFNKFLTRMLGKQWNEEKAIITDLYKSDINNIIPRRIANFRYKQHLKLHTTGEHFTKEEIIKIFLIS